MSKRIRDEGKGFLGIRFKPIATSLEDRDKMPICND